mgnify:CR=1 FL=1
MKSFKVDNINHFVVDEYITRINIIDLINKQITPKEKRQIFICPYNALSKKDNSIIKSESCINCQLCDIKFACLTNKCENIDLSNLDNILSSLPHVSIFLKLLYPNAVTATEVKISGNYRNKRIDVVLIQGNTIFIFKVLTEANKIDYYYRSYSKILDNLNNEISGYATKLFFLTTEDIANSSIDIQNYQYITLSEIIKEGI